MLSDEIQEKFITTNSNSFDKILETEPRKILVQAKRIFYLAFSGTNYQITLDSKNPIHEIIFKACGSGFQSEWFTGLTELSKRSYLDHVRIFFQWINDLDCKLESQNKYLIVKEYESFRMNVQGKRKSPLEYINVVIRKGLSSSFLSREEIEYLETLLSLSKPDSSGEKVQLTLSSWFDIPWLRNKMNESEYLQLDSPRLLFKSFRVTIATTLIWIQEQRSQWKKFSALSFDQSISNWAYIWGRQLFEHVGTVGSNGGPENDFNELLWLDLVKPYAREGLKEILANTPSIELPYKFPINGNKNPPWQKPVFFHPSYQEEYSPLEEMLCSWLIACEAVQPSDIKKLKKSNYAREYNRHGKLIAMECNYYKGRSGTTKQTAIMLGDEPWTRAMEGYMNGLSGSLLFKTNISRPCNLLPPSSEGRHKTITLLYEIWKRPSVTKMLESELNKNESSFIFLRAMFALENGNSIGGSDRIRKTIGELQATVPNLLPRTMFSLSHIKTTAIHAGSDNYRYNDLVNHHSHTSLTEKISYLTDSNKDWVNRSGRITRLVIHDLQNIVFQPSISTIINAVREMDLRTKIIESKNYVFGRKYNLNIYGAELGREDELIVQDCTDSALYFIHYISQAEIMLPKLLRVRPDWVERTLVIQVEWMSLTLSRMKSAASAKQYYKEVASHLPNLFDYFLDSSE